MPESITIVHVSLAVSILALCVSFLSLGWNIYKEDRCECREPRTAEVNLSGMTLKPTREQRSRIRSGCRSSRRRRRAERTSRCR
jgi:hypothetical protein